MQPRGGDLGALGHKDKICIVKAPHSSNVGMCGVPSGVLLPDLTKSSTAPCAMNQLGVHHPD